MLLTLLIFRLSGDLTGLIHIMVNHTYFISVAETEATLVKPRANLWIDEGSVAHLATTTDIIGTQSLLFWNFLFAC